MWCSKHAGSSRSNAIECGWWVRELSISHEIDSNLNISPKMSCGVLECDIVGTELRAYDFVMKALYVIK